MLRTWYKRWRLARKLRPIKKQRAFWEKWRVTKHKDKTLEESFRQDMVRSLQNVNDLDELADYIEYRIVMHVKRLSFQNDRTTEHQRGRLFELVRILEDINSIRKADKKQ